MGGGKLAKEAQARIAAKYGFLDYLKHLHAEGFIGNAITAANAALGGSLDCLVYLHKNGNFNNNILECIMLLTLKRTTNELFAKSTSWPFVTRPFAQIFFLNFFWAFDPLYS
eukprot:Phypoly_transcript_16039.p2 GENE.Phypoly_transcript_16039~~Phypoly_transcript_16039.p2  ORF type:complete len:112 (-),score=7.81 Phypoly_transcript_16039:221-556(-)